MNLFETNTHSAKTKTGKVLAHLQERGSINAWKAIQLYRATRLSAIIFDLRVHYKITMHKPNKKPYGIYTYKGKK